MSGITDAIPYNGTGRPRWLASLMDAGHKEMLEWMNIAAGDAHLQDGLTSSREARHIG